MGIQIRIKDKNGNKKLFDVNDVYSEIGIECGDWIYVDEVKSSIAFDVINTDLKLTFSNGCAVVLLNLIQLFMENPNGNIAGQFNDIALLNAVTTKLEFLKSDLFDDAYCIEDITLLNTVVKIKQSEEEKLNMLEKSVKFQYDKQTELEVKNEKFDVYAQENLTIFIHI